MIAAGQGFARVRPGLWPGLALMSRQGEQQANRPVRLGQDQVRQVRSAYARLHLNQAQFRPEPGCEARLGPGSVTAPTRTSPVSPRSSRSSATDATIKPGGGAGPEGRGPLTEWVQKCDVTELGSTNAPGHEVRQEARVMTN
jgi:hypothetical protein